MDKKKTAVMKLKDTLLQAGMPLSMGLSGSTAIGVQKSTSDLDFWICINEEDLPALEKNEQFATLAGLDKAISQNQNIIQELKDHKLDVLNLKSEVEGERCSFDIYTRRSFSDISNLRNFKVKRWRYMGIRKTSVIFKNVKGEETVGECEAQGWYSKVRNVLIKKNTYYFGQHVDRIASSRVIIDDLETREDILVLWVKIIMQAKKLNVSPEQFLYRNQDIPDTIKGNFMDLINDLSSDLIKWQTLLKSTDTIILAKALLYEN